MFHTIHNPTYLILLRVESEPPELWRSLRGNIVFHPLATVSRSFPDRTETYDFQDKGDMKCPAH